MWDPFGASLRQTVGVATSRPDRIRGEVARLSTRGLDIARFFDEAGRILGKAVAFDGFCSMTVDPATMLLTSHIAH